ncbi:MAG: phosphodiesterase [Cyanobacteria bacterium J06642_2]
MKIAQISDLHVQAEGDRAYGVVDTNALVKKAIAHLNHLSPRPDCVVATGDLVHRGTVAEYEQLKSLLFDLEIPIYLLPGNHDRREHLRQVFDDCDYWPESEDYLHYAVETSELRLLMLDTVVPGEGGGELDEARLTWLQLQLERDGDRPVIIFMHHPPFDTGIVMMDRIGLKGRDRFAEVVARHPQVERVACGHLHRAIHCRWAGTIASTQPSLVHQVALDFQPNAKGYFFMEPPAYTLHDWDGSSLVSHTLFVGDFDGPHPFIERQIAAGSVS